MVIIKNQKEIGAIRQSCRLAAETLKWVGSLIRPGISTLYLNDNAHHYLVEHGGVPAPLHYNGYPKSICTSVNDVVCHGIPSDKTILKNGDIINIDITAILDGYYGDVSASYPVGQISPEAEKLLKVVKDALDKSIKALKPGKYLNECVGQVIEPYVKKFGFSVVRELGGHGVGLQFHEEPFVYHFDIKRKDILLEPGMIFTIEPMVNCSRDWRIVLNSKDHWTVTTRDGSLSAQFEHTILITPTGHEVLTAI